jgi:hypothetical protein
MVIPLVLDELFLQPAATNMIAEARSDKANFIGKGFFMQNKSINVKSGFHAAATALIKCNYRLNIASNKVF